MQTRPANSQEIAAWEKFQGWYEVIYMQNTINQLKRQQIDIGGEFCAANGLESPITSLLDQTLQNNELSQVAIERIRADVEDEKIGLHFPNGPTGRMDLVGPLDLNQDELAQYQFSGVLVIIGGGMIILGLTLKVIELYDRLELTEQNEQIALDMIEAEIARKPELELVWEAHKQQQGWNEKQDELEEIKRKVVEAIDDLKKPLSTGISWGIPIVAGIALLYLMLGRK